MSSRVFSLDARQLRFPSLAPRVERGLPWSLPRPFCLSPGFSFPVDPYRTGEFLLAVSVTPRQSLAAVLHTLCQDSFSPRECFVLTRFYGLAISQYMRTSLAAITSPWQGLGAHEHTSPIVFFFSLLLFMLMAVKRTGSVDIPYFDSHLHCCGVSVPGEARLRGGLSLRRSQNAEKLQAWAEARAARNFRHRVFLLLRRYPILRLTSSRCECARGGAAAGWIEKVSECRETAGVGRGARCSFSDRAAGGVSAGRRGEA